MRRTSIISALLSSTRWLCSIEGEGQEEQPGAGGSVQDLGGATRVVPDGGAADQAAREHAANMQGGEVAPEEKPGEGEAEQKPGEEKAPEEKPEAKDGDYDFKGTPFEGMTPEFQASVTPFVKAFDEAGTLSDEQISEAAKATGFSEGMVRQWMEGVKAQNTVGAAEVALNNAPVFEAVGGAEEFAAFQKWSTEPGNLSEAEEAGVNALLKTDPAAAAALMGPLVDRWKAAGGGKPAADLAGKGSEGGPSGAEGVQPYETWAQVQVDMNDPRYANDAAFRSGVERRLAVSNF